MFVIVNVSDEASVVIWIPVPAAIVKESVLASAAIVDCPDTAIFLKTSGCVALIVNVVPLTPKLTLLPAAIEKESPTEEAAIVEPPILIEPKALLLSRVAHSKRCRAIWIFH